MSSRLSTVGVQRTNGNHLPDAAATQFVRIHAETTEALRVLMTKGRRGRQEAARHLAGAIAACELLKAWLHGGRT